MEIKSSDLVSLFEKSLRGVSEDTLRESGIVILVGDSYCQIYGLLQALYGELVTFEGGNKGIILNLDENVATVFLLETLIPVNELERVYRTGEIFKTPVGMHLLGRVVNALTKPIDALGAIETDEMRPVESVIPGIIDHSPINQSLETGITAVDALVPIGRGQRELIIGNRNTGKSTMVLDVIRHQKGKNVICIYVSVGQRQATVARFARALEENGSLGYTTIVSADASEPALNKYLAPYIGCTMAEYFRDQDRDVLIVYDDLSEHAVAYREMSLLMRRAPGREAYPGDVFYLHARLLERAGKLAKGGSITALPIVRVQGDDITAYIPTNLISITDGQVFLDTKLFNNGIRPAVNVELSVSRVGGAAQTKAMKQVTRALRLELAQYHELLGFSQFGTELDIISQKRLARGARVVELLKQPEHVTYSFVDQVLRLFALKENFLDALAIDQVNTYCNQLVSYVRSVYPALYDDIKAREEITEETKERLIQVIKEFNKIFVPEVY